MRLLRLPLHIAVATLYSASFAVAVAALVAVATQRLDYGARTGAVALLAACAAFGTYLWRTYRPARVAKPKAAAPEPMVIEAEPEPLRAAA